ncbi:GxxExxY protein [Spirosoma sp. KCTC 42546]|uniref:GxxExxY protein n=1 Tax=Spirosoma sp. KCTC 42546 TaxID=2520506 RepID=UPI0011572CC3|nr:GxxExxY protein [Spirosoma sp. KCTC 42546]QDK77997.1 GxxExxY protein [Spirosoma sp. KCTC 42546]
MNERIYNTLNHKIIGACIEVHRELGPGLLESVYEECLAFELEALGLHVERQVELPVVYKGHLLNKTFFMDIVVEEMIVIELKAVQELTPLNHIQTLTYLRMAQMKLGLLINFNVELLRDGIHRKINGKLNK